jgi:prolyl oligopeptidase
MRHLSALTAMLLLAACATTDSAPAPVASAPAAPAQPARASAMPTDLSPEGVKAADPYLWLEEVHGQQTMDWVNQRNADAHAKLEEDRRFETYRSEAYAILSATDRTPIPTFLDGRLYNFWEDDAHIKGIWRRTTLASYRSAAPQWETVFDVDALARTEGKNWIWKGADCLGSDERYCLISLSDGGKDAVELREFDTRTRQFVAGGFRLPEGKHRVSWLDRDTLLVATDFGPGTLTESGYPYIVRTLKRGQTLDQATEVYRGAQGDGGYGVSANVMHDADGKVLATIVDRPLDTFRAEQYLLTPQGPKRLALPSRVALYGMLGDRLILVTAEDWSLGGQSFKAGSLLAIPLKSLTGTPGTIDRNQALLFEPTARQSVNSGVANYARTVVLTRDRVVASIYDNVRGGLVSFAPGRTGWTRTSLPIPANASVNLVDASRRDNRQVFYSVEGFITPSTLMLGDASTGQAATIRTSPARFDATNFQVDQFEATSSDGARIPYFVVRPKALAMDGKAPTIMYGYGGFEVSKPPAYIAEMGKLWLEKGGVYVNANIRGGGEFGPNWHQSVLRENRQLAFDDFAAVARDLIARNITSPQHLGIYGRSNGGVLTSVSITQHPELFNAAVIESPLIDMLRYPYLPAGASWIGEYGDPRLPADAGFIARYSGYQNVRWDQPYPRVYVTTNTGDDRVHPGHARKFTARMLEYGYNPVYFEDTSGGHSYDADPRANARRWARHYVYLAQQLMDDTPHP